MAIDPVCRGQVAIRPRRGRECPHMGQMKDRMLRGELYIADDPDLVADNARA